MPICYFVAPQATGTTGLPKRKPMLHGAIFQEGRKSTLKKYCHTSIFFEGG